jgi:hypothetical protein
MLGTAVAKLISESRERGLPASLPFGTPVAAARASLAAIGDDDLAPGRAVRDQRAAACLRAGLWVLHDFMDQAHQLVDDMETLPGSYWHAIVHRREPDAGNARYWFGQVGAHPIFGALLADARALAGEVPAPLRQLLSADRWRPELFVRLATSDPTPAVERILLAIQRREWELLFEHTFQQAFGGR